MENGKIAVPSMKEGGMDGIRAGHFGHCDCFTIIDVKNGQIEKIGTVKNQEHVQGGCMLPVNLLGAHNVTALVVGGIGMRPLEGFKQVGIEVFFEGTRQEIKPVVEDLIAGKLQQITNEQVCGGHG